jgi:hypothetical protein
MKKNVAHSAIINFHRIFIPKINEEIHNALANILPNVSLQQGFVKPTDVVQTAIQANPEFKINVDAKSPKDEPTIDKNQKVIDPQKELLEQLQKAKEVSK